MSNLVSIPDNKKYDGMFLVSTEKKGTSLECFIEVNNVNIYYSSATKVISVIDEKNNKIGVFIGVVVDYKNNKVINAETTLKLDYENYINSIETQIYQFCGTWIFILCDENYKRLYLDPCGSYSAVYDPVNKAAASITGQLLNDKEFVDKFDKQLYTELGIHNLGWIPAGLTAHEGINRLICNHYLDLKSWKSIRHWPKDKFIQNNDVRDVSQKIAGIIQSTINSLSRDGSTCLTLTGGKDSRLILSGINKIKDKVDLITINLPGSELDVYLAKKIVSLDKQLKHTVYPPVKATIQRTNEWLYNASYCLGGINQYYSPSNAPLSKYKYLVGGVAGEIGRAFFWRESDTKDTTIYASMLISRLGLKYNSKIEIEIEKWLSELSEYDTFTILDLAYTELRVSPWAFAQSYSYECIGQMTQVSPFVNREIISLLFTLPAKARRDEIYIFEGISFLWPELLTIQFNKFNNYRDYLEIVKKLFIPGLLVSKLRKMLSIS